MSTTSRNASRRTWRLIVFFAFLSLLAIASVRVMVTSVARAAPPAKQAPPSSDKLPGQIEDDATVAPDAEESADNNVTFPVDI